MPAPKSPEPEWIELFNYGNDIIIIDTLIISDPTKSSKLFNFELKPQSYCLITSDTLKLKSSRTLPNDLVLYQLSLPTFNNTSDFCKLNISDIIIDSIFYDMDWGVQGKSFERINPEQPILDQENIMVSLDSSGATAGRLNSKKLESTNDKTFFKINEIMFDVNSNNAEYIELYNYSQDTANLKYCQIHDATGKGIDISQDVYILPNDYIVIFWDTLIFNKFSYLKDSLNYYYSPTKISLNNDQDIVLVKNYKDSLIDSVSYNSSWHNPNLEYTKDVSLEKTNENLLSDLKDSWSSCTNNNGGTPGEKNSYSSQIQSKDELSIFPNPFSISKSGTNIKVRYQIPFSSCKLNLRIYDTEGFLVSHPINNQFFGKSGEFDLLPLDMANRELIPQAYVILLEATDTISGSIYESKSLLIIAE